MLNDLKLFFHRALHQDGGFNRAAIILNVFLATMVVLNIAGFVLFSIPEYRQILHSWEETTVVLFVLVFGIEYALRVWSANAKPPYKESLPITRKRYLRSLMGVIDLMAFLPALLVWLLPSDTFGDLRILKLLAIIRIVKLTRYSDSLTVLARLYHDNAKALIATAMIMMLLSFLAAAGIYVFEHEAQPELFGSIPAAMWWAFVSLSTVGYGDMVPITVGGKLFGVFVMISGVGIAAMPAGIFASSFVQLIREQERQRRHSRSRKLAHPHHAQDCVAQQAEDYLASAVATASSKTAKVGYSVSADWFSASEKREVDYLIAEFGLNYEQAAGVVMHYRH